jgi:hypothetical protein
MVMVLCWAHASILQRAFVFEEVAGAILYFQPPTKSNIRAHN